MKLIHLKTSLVVFILGIASTLHAQLDKELPFDPAITVGQFENGLTYFIRENAEPKNRANFQLVVKAGALLEKDDEQGIAHFLEHLGFNGTKNFEKQELIDYLQSIGMRFGAHLNAHTSFDETVYKLEIPMDKEEILSNTFQILEDWAHQMILDPEEIEKERGVILEERRLRLGAGMRMREIQFPILFKDSQYAERNIIGHPETISSITREQFQNFYSNYYRPDLMAVVAVGDFDKEKIEALIRKHFEHLKNPENAPPVPEFPVPDHDETLFSIATDPELSNTSVQIVYKRDRNDMVTEGDYRNQLKQSLYNTMLNNRLRERTLEKEPPFLGARIAKSRMIGSLDSISMSAGVEEGQYAEGLKALLVENRRAMEAGFTQPELQRAKANMMRRMQTALREKDQRRSSSHVGEIIRYFTSQSPIPGIEIEMQLTRKYLRSISLDEVNRVADDWFTNENRVILFTSPEKEGLAVPTEAEILAVLQEGEALPYEPYEEADLSAPLVDQTPNKGSIVEERYHDSVDVTEWTLSNGIKVFLKPTDFKSDQVMLSAFSPGGHSLVNDEFIVPAQNAGRVISSSGMGKYSAQDLSKKMAGKKAAVRPSISSLYENLSGSGSPDDLDTLFQKVYLRFTGPRMDEDIFGATLVQMRNYAKNRLNDPGQVFQDAIDEKLYGDHPRNTPFDDEYIDAMDLQKSFEIYKDRFADASDFTFVMVGAFDVAKVRPLAEQWLASLPDLDREETWRDTRFDRIRGKNEVVVRKGLEPKSSVQMAYYGPAEWSYHEGYLMASLMQVVNIPMREALREDKGGVYGVGVSGRLTREPRGKFVSSIRYGCDPDMVDELIRAAKDVIQKIKTEGPDPEHLAAVKEQQLRSNERNLRQNNFWMSSLSTYIRNDIEFDAVHQRDARTEALTADMIREAAIKYFDDTNYFEAKLFPEAEPNTAAN